MKKKELLKLTSAFLSLLITLLILIIIFAVASVNSKSIFGYRFFIVVSYSMSGSIEKDEFIITKKVDPKSLRKDDIITFISSDVNILGEINTHRIVRIEDNLIYTKGDANLTEDGDPVAYDSVIGKVIYHSKVFGYVINKLGNPLILFVFIILPLSLMAISELRTIKLFVKAIKKIRKHYDANG